MKNVKIILILLCAALAACSSDDEQEQDADGRRLRLLTIADGPVTRATLTESGNTMGATWNKDDVATFFNVTVFDEGNMNYGSLTASNSEETSTFTGTVFCKEGDDIALLYPAKTPDISSGDDRGKFTISLSGQKGTLADIQENFHYVYGVAKVTSVTESTANANIDNMKSLLAVCKFTFKDEDNKLIPVKTLKISYYESKIEIGYHQSAKLTPTEDVSSLTISFPVSFGDGVTVNLDKETCDGVYVALFPNQGFPEDEWPTGMLFTVTDGSGNTYTGTATAKLTAGKYYPANITLTK